MNLWKLRAPNPRYDPMLPISTGPEYLIEIIRPCTTDRERAQAEATARQAIDGLAWEPTPL